MTEVKTLDKKHFDVIVVGGGMVGATQAIAFKKAGRSVLLIEQNIPQRQWLDAVPLRVSAINLTSEKLLTDLGIWSSIDAKDQCYFNQLATWEHQSNKLMFDSQSLNMPRLGHLVRNEAIQLAAFELCQSYVSDKFVISDSHIVSLNQSSSEVVLELQATDSLIKVSSNIIIGADGANSQIRQLANIGTNGWQYQQHCFSITIKTEFAAQHITWQEFQKSGPKAFLPLSDGYACLIWYDNAATIKNLLALSNEQLKNEIIQTFPALPGDFEVANRASFPLVRRQANHYYKGRVVLVGDAAHVINPLAGQGVNLGFKDVIELSEKLSSADLSDSAALKNAFSDYQFKRKADALLISATMDILYHSFSNNNSTMQLVRNAALSVIEGNGWVKKVALQKAVGLALFSH